MGNCGRKMKKELDSWKSRRRTGAVSIDSGMQCPKCGTYFSPNTSYNTINNHLDNCVVTQDSFVNPNNIHINAQNPNNQINAMLFANDPQNNQQGQHYVWKKIQKEDGTISWEKSLSSKTKSEDHLCNMSAESAKELKFEDKQLWFKIQNEKVRIPWTYGSDQFFISKTNLVDSAIQGLKKVNLYKEVKLEIEEEKKVHDAGGLLREFIQLFCQEVFKPERGIFIKSQTEEVIYSINPRATNSKENLELLKCLGKIFAKAVFEQMTMPVQMNRLFLKSITQQEFELDDLLTVDKQLYNSLKFIKENSISNSDVFEEYFVEHDPNTGQEVELKELGKNIKIDDDNKIEYLKLKLDWIGKKSIEKKISSFLEGFNQVIAKENISVFSIEEVEMIFNGLPFLDLTDWESNTNYKGSYYKNHQIMKWFWQIMKELSQEQLRKFFQFCTGSTRAPIEGFRALQSNRGEMQKFTIESIKYSKENRGLKAHTCFNRLEMPMYPTKEMLKENMLVILSTDFDGVFGIE